MMANPSKYSKRPNDIIPNLIAALFLALVMSVIGAIFGHFLMKSASFGVLLAVVVSQSLFWGYIARTPPGERR